MKCKGGRVFENIAEGATETNSRKGEFSNKPGVKHLHGMEVETPTRWE